MAVRQGRTLLVCGLAALLAASLLTYLSSPRQSNSPQPETTNVVEQKSSTPPLQPVEVKAAAPTEPEPAVHISATQVLAVVNGKKLMLGDLVPVGPKNKDRAQDFSPETYRYLLDRAINRELILQAAKAQSVTLDDSQVAQLAEFRRQRDQREPGLVQQLNRDETQIDFEVRDAQAFMLQTTLLAKSGASPNVTEQDALDYYSQHTLDYPKLPTDEPARSQAWANIDDQIRNALAPMKRAAFQSLLTAYMDQLKSTASIALTQSNQ